MTMRFISPKTDFAFKKIFGSRESKKVLISLLNSLIYAEQPVIQDLEIINPYNSGMVEGLKDSYLDVKAVLNNNSIVIIEMQVVNIASFEKRVVYNLAKTYGNQLKSGEGYSKLNPVIALTITDFELFKQIEEIITFWVFKEQTKSIDYAEEELKMVFVELPKFHKKLEELETITDKWLYFIKESSSLEAIPATMEEVPEIVQALNIANQANLNIEELEDLHKREMFFEDQRGAFIKGMEEGEEKGRVEGEKKLIRRLLERRFGDSSQVARLLESRNLSVEQLEDLGVALLDFTTIEEVVNYLESRL